MATTSLILVRSRPDDGPSSSDWLGVVHLRVDATTRWVIDAAGDLLQLTRDTTIVERRPLEETRLYSLYRRVRVVPPDLR